MALATTYNVNTNREDLSNDLTILEPEETPVLSMIRKGAGPKAVFQEWVVDDLDNPGFTPVPEGEDVTTFSNAADNRQRLGNYVHIFRRSWQVSDVQQEVDSAGVDNEVANSKAKKLRELKRDIECAICGDDEMVATGPGYGMRGLGKWIEDTAQSVNPVPADFRTPAGSLNSTAAASFVEADVNGVLQSIWEQTNNRKNYTLVAGSSLKNEISSFSRLEGSSGTTKTYMVTENATSKQVTFGVDLYNGDFGVISIISTTFYGRTAAAPTTYGATQKMRGYVLDPSLLSFNYLWSPFGQELEDKGGGRRGFVKAAGTLQVKNPLGFGKFEATA